MVYAVALISTLLLATAALAAPSGLNARLAHRREGRLSKPFIPAPEPAANATQFSQNWSGAVWDSTPAGTFTSVAGTIIVPTPKAANGSDSGAASAWVGIDGDTCQTAILQTGIDVSIDGGEVSYDAWYEWFPDFAHDFDGIDINAGDTIIMTVTTTSTTSGTAIIENKTTGQTVNQPLTSSKALCQQNAEWIVEDFEQGDSLVTFANFGIITFTDAVAKTTSGSTMGPSGATEIDIRQNNVTLTAVSTTSAGLVVSYV